MGLFGSDSFLGSLLGGSSGSKISNVPQGSVQNQFADILNLLFNIPAFGQSFQMAAALGQNPWEYMDQFAAPLTAEGPNILNLPGLGNKFDVGKMMQAQAGLSEQFETKQLEFFQDFMNKLEGVPALQDIVQKSKGQNLLSKEMTAAFEGLAGAALGGGASSGFITDPLMQQNVLGPVAMQKAMTEFSIQQDAQSKLLSLAGVGGIPGMSQAGMFGTGPSPWTGAAGSAAGLFGAPNLQSAFGAASLNTQLGQEMSMFNSGILGLSGGGGGGGGGSQALNLGMLGYALYACWVAEELYGPWDARTHCARLYAITHDSRFLRLYRRHGRAWAAWLAAHPWAKPLVAPIWDEMARRGALMLRRKVA